MKLKMPRPDVLAVAWLIAIPVIFAHRALVGDGSLAPDRLLDQDTLEHPTDPPPRPRFDDTSPVLFDFPRDLSFARGLHHGRFDTWSPLVGAGQPMWADEHGPFVPFKLPFDLVPTRRGYDWFLFLRFVCGGLGAWALARRRGLGQPASAAAGTLFQFSGAMIASAAFGTVTAICLLPWMLLAARAIADDRSLGATAGAACVVGLVGNSGHPETMLLVLVAFVVAIAAHALRRIREPKRAAHIAGLGALAFSLGIALSAPTILPLVELRANAVTYKQFEQGERVYQADIHGSRESLPIALFTPRLLDAARTDLIIHWPWSASPVLGALGLVLALAGLFQLGLDEALAAVLVLGLGLTLAPPGLKWLHGLPLIHYPLPSYSWSLVALPLTQAGALAIERADRPRGRLFLLGGAAIMIGALAWMILKHHSVAHYSDALNNLLGDRVAKIIVFPLLAVLVVVSMFFLTRRHAIPLIALVALEGVVTMTPIAIYDRSNVLRSPESPALSFLDGSLKGSDWRMIGFPITEGRVQSLEIFQVRDLRVIAALPMERYVRYLSLIRNTDIGTAFTSGAPMSAMLDLASVRYFVVAKGGFPWAWLYPGDPELRQIYDTPTETIWRNLDARPRARITRKIAVVSSENDAAIKLLPVAKTPHLTIDQPTIIEGAEPLDDTTMLQAGENARIVDERDPGRVVIEANATRPSYLELADAYYPGWSATVDGKPTKIYPADVLFRAVKIPAGQHKIVFTYVCRPLRWGAAIALAGLLGIAAIFWRARRARRRA
jgi:hypothetical protein